MNSREIPSKKSHTVTVRLSGVFGVFGIQHLYMGRWIGGIVDMSFFVATIYSPSLASPSGPSSPALLTRSTRASSRSCC